MPSVMSQCGAKLHISFNGLITARTIRDSVDLGFAFFANRKIRHRRNGAVWMGNKNQGKTPKSVWLFTDHSPWGRPAVTCATAGGDSVIVEEEGPTTTRLEIEDGCGVNVVVMENGWRVRRLVQKEEEMREVAYVQAQAFYNPMMFFNGFFFEIFKAEVLSGLLYKIRNSAPNRYGCMVAESAAERTCHHTPVARLVGVVDVTALQESGVLRFLDGGADEYLYVSGIAVLPEFRRRRVATVLLKGCDLMAMHWKFDYLALHAYEDDTGARTLYSNAGYRVVAKDPPWMSSWIGRKPRVLMIKNCSTSPMINEGKSQLRKSGCL